MLEKIEEIKIKLMEYFKTIPVKRVAIIAGIVVLTIILIVVGILLYKKNMESCVPVKVETPEATIKVNVVGTVTIDKNSYVGLSKYDKGLAFAYLEKKFKGKNVTISLYKVKKRENYWGIAKQNKINIDTIIGANPELENLKAFLNKQLVILSKKGIIHEVISVGETPKKLAELYKVNVEEIKTNNNLFFGIAFKGDLIFVPDTKPVYISDNLKRLYAERNMFRSPLSGRYTSLMGVRIHPVTGQKSIHQGVDIKAKMGSWVGAAADGKVMYAGWGGNLGNCIKIVHKDGYMTVYGHLSKIFVKNGQTVFAGKLIAKTGNTGRTTGPHLHFAIFKNEKLQDPLKYLW
ncbi:MAG: peptidoglycan DD-metalloendopeptidase family protein [bacterium]